MAKINKNSLGLSLGIFAALLHAVWAILVAAGVAKSLLDWVLPLHFVGAMFSITSFSIVSAILLVVLAFVGGYVTGWVFAAIWNKFGK